MMTLSYSPRERVINTLKREESDIVPYHIAVDSDCLNKLNDQGLLAKDLLEQIDNHLPHIGLEPHKQWFDEVSYVDDFGCRWRVRNNVPHLDEFPLKEPSLTGYTFPDLLDGKYFHDIPPFLEEHQNHYRLCGIVFGYHDRCWNLRGWENFLSDVILHPNFIEAVLEQLIDSYVHLINRIAQYPFDGIRFADDWGYQRGVLVGAKRWRKLFLPGLRKIFQYARSKHLTVMVHADGDLSEIIPDLIDAGVEILNPMQPECMDILWLKKEYGKYLCFNGGISSQLTIPRGTPDQIKKEIQAALRYLGKNGGFVIGPTKSLNVDSPLENNLAVIDALVNQEPQSTPSLMDDHLPDRVDELWAVYRAFHPNPRV